MMERINAVWVDSDVLALRSSFPDVTPFFAGRYTNVMSNTVLYIDPATEIFTALKDLICEEYPDPEHMHRKEKLIMREAAKQGQKLHRNQLRATTVTGPFRMTRMLSTVFGMPDLFDEALFYPLPYEEAVSLLEPAFDITSITPEAYGLHAWGSVLRKRISRHGVHEESFIGKAFRRQGIEDVKYLTG